MSKMNLDGLDLNLLMVLDALGTELNATRAARKIGASFTRSISARYSSASSTIFQRPALYPLGRRFAPHRPRRGIAETLARGALKPRIGTRTANAGTGRLVRRHTSGHVGYGRVLAVAAIVAPGKSAPAKSPIGGRSAAWAFRCACSITWRLPP